MINTQRLIERRKELGLNQEDVAERVKNKYGVGSQQGYWKLETGRVTSSKYLNYYCDVLDIDVSEIDISMKKNKDSLKSLMEKAISAIDTLPQEKQFEVAMRVLENIRNQK